MSQINVDTIKKADGTGSLSVPAESGTVVTTASPSLGRRNLIINGAMQVAQRGTSSTTDGYGSVDRFRSNYGGGTVTQSQESLSSGAPFDLGFRKFFRTTNTSVVTDTAANFRILRQNIEDQNVATSGWNYKSSDSYITLSFWVRSSVAQEFYAYLLVPPVNYNYAFSTGTLAANTWTKVTKTIPGNSNLSLDNDNTIGIELNVIPFFGTNYTASGSTTDAWFAFSGSSRVPDMTSTWATTSGATFDLTGVQLEVGSIATPFEHRSYGEELALCQRYYYRRDRTNGDDGLATSAAHTGSSTYGVMMWPVTMRANPTFGYGTSGFTVVGNAALTTPSSLGMERPYVHGGTIYTTGVSVTQGYCYWLRMNTSGAYIDADAEL